MHLDDFDFDLPKDRIALRPVRPRDSARLLCVSPHAQKPFQDKAISDLIDHLAPGDGLVFNDTRVVPAGLKGFRTRDGNRAAIALTLYKRLDQSHWRAFARPAKRLAVGDRIDFDGDKNTNGGAAFWGRVSERRPEGEITLAFDLSGPDLDQAIARHGQMPLPPYIAGKRAADARDKSDYQTVYAAREGAVAAPTAGLHFTPELIAALKGRGVTCCFVTLHVGPGTFLPVKTSDPGSHKMHAEWGEVSAETAAALNAIAQGGGRLTAVGTTALRLIESAARSNGVIEPFSGDTELFIRPGYRFKAAGRLLTNFHLPRSTLFMLVAAFSGLDLMKQAYAHAIANGYRFYSYGDACLLEPENAAP